MKRNIYIILILLSGVAIPIIGMDNRKKRLDEMDKAVAELQQMKDVDLPTVYNQGHPILKVIAWAHFDFVGEKIDMIKV